MDHRIPGRKCVECQEYNILQSSSVCVITTKGLFPPRSVFAHNGKLILYAVTKYPDPCKTCHTNRYDFVYMKDGEYHTMFDSTLSITDCEIKCDLQPNNGIMMRSDIGVFVIPYGPYLTTDVLFVRGIKIDYIPKDWMHILYLDNTRKDMLQNSIFTSLIDDKKNTYIIDRNGNALMHEKLKYVSGKSKLNSSGWEWQVYANSKMQVEIRGFFDSIKILEDTASVGRHTKPAIHGANE